MYACQAQKGALRALRSGEALEAVDGHDHELEPRVGDGGVRPLRRRAAPGDESREEKDGEPSEPGKEAGAPAPSGRAPHSNDLTAIPPATWIAPSRSSTPRTTCPRVLT